MDITYQSEKMNNTLVEKRIDKSEIKNIVDKSINKEDEQLEKALRIYDKIIDIIIEEEATMQDAYLITAAIAESIYNFSIFGDVDE